VVSYNLCTYVLQDPVVVLDKNRSFGAVVPQERNTWRVRDSAVPTRRLVVPASVRYTEAHA